MLFQVHTLDTAPVGARETLGKVAQNFGFVPNLSGVFAESPATLNGLVGFLSAYDAKEMTLSALERRVVLLAASVKYKCEHCTALHSALGSMCGLDRAEIDNLQEARSLGNARLESLRRFTEAVVEKHGWVSDADLEKFFAAGFTKAQVIEVIFGVALKTLTSYVSHIAKPPSNEQFAAFRAKWADAAYSSKQGVTR